MNKLLILDRDGVINEDSPNHIRSVREWFAIPNSIKAIANAYKKGYIITVASNQSGIARGYFSQEDVDAIHEKIKSLVIQAGGNIDYFRYCPHDPEAGCRCRKPAPGMLVDLCKRYTVQTKDVWFVGDSLKDLQAGFSIGCKSALVLTGNGNITHQLLVNHPNLKKGIAVFNDLYEFSNHLP